MPRPREQDPMTRLSKQCSWLLRHGAHEKGLTVREDGFVLVADMLRCDPGFRGFGEAEVRAVVAACEKQRFALLEEADGRLYIRANQGHTAVRVSEDALLEPVSAKRIPVCVHGTTAAAWRSIRRTGLKRMDRQHIHFATGLPDDGGVISGMRSSSSVCVYVDAPRAAKAGVRFFRSANGVILSPGLGPEGVIPPEFFKRVDVRGQAAPVVDFICVLDFEATCFEGPRHPTRPQEIIEFPSVLLNASTFEEVSRFRTYVRPTLQPELSAFCTELTGITQEQVDAAPAFPEALEQHTAWLRGQGLLTEGGPTFLFATCGDWDCKTGMTQQCALLEMPVPDHFLRWINVKRNARWGTPVGPDMLGMLEAMGLELLGRHHSGLDDCVNIGRLMAAMARAGDFFGCTTTSKALQFFPASEEASEEASQQAAGAGASKSSTPPPPPAAPAARPAPRPAPRGQPPAFIGVLDFEATCWNHRGKQQEIIEFPTVLLDGRSLEVVDEFRTYVRPVVEPQISDFCTELTGITQQQVDPAPVFAEALQQHTAWLQTHEALERGVIFLTCGDWDLNQMLPEQLKLLGSPEVPRHFRQWINVKRHFCEATSAQRAPGMAGMLRALSLPLEGRHHSGLDDCRNIARIVQVLGKRGVAIGAPTGSLKPRGPTKVRCLCRLPDGTEREVQVAPKAARTRAQLAKAAGGIVRSRMSVVDGVSAASAEAWELDIERQYVLQ